MTDKTRTLSLREQILDSKSNKPQTYVMPFFGFEIELRQPTIGAVIDAQEASDNKSQADASVDLIIQFAHVPGSTDRVFEETDRELLKHLPFGPDMIAIQRAISKLTGIDVEDAVKNLKEAQQDTT